MTTLSCRGVASRVGDATILRDLDLEVPAGTMTVVVGPSGAGKTSLLRAVAGLGPVTTGSIHLGGDDLAGRPVHRRGLAMVFQQPRLFPALSVQDNVAFALRMAGMSGPDRRSRAVELLDEVGLAGLGDRGIDGLSGGEAQRVALARALAGEPDLLLLDEPLSSVDPNRRESLRTLIGQLQRQRGVTTLYVTHDRTEAAALGDRVALLIEGRIVQHAPPQDLFERPRSAVVARFFGATNLVPGTVRDGRLRQAGIDLPSRAGDGPATLVVRPEHLHVGTARASEDGTITGRVRTTTYTGGHHRIEVEVEGDRGANDTDHEQPVVVAEVADACEPGQPVRLWVEAARVWTLPDGGPAMREVATAPDDGSHGATPITASERTGDRP